MPNIAAGSGLGSTSPAQLAGSGHHPAVLHAPCRQHRARQPPAFRTEARAVEQVTTDQLKRTHLITAIKTPYIDNGKFDLPAFDRLVEHQIESGVQGLIIGGTTGEGQLMSWDEHVMLIAHTVNRFGDQVRVIGNTGSNSTREAVHATSQGFAVGMHAALQINPYYGKTSATGMRTHFEACLDLGPAIIYNVPARTAQDIPDDVIADLAAHSNFLGVKECTGNQRIQAEALQGHTDAGIASWSGNDDEAHAARHDHGAAGVISVTSNMVPGLFSRLMRQRDDAQNEALQDLMGWMFCEPNPIAVNTALAMCGLVKPVFRLPYVPLSTEQRRRGVELLQPLLAHIPGADGVREMADGDFAVLANF